MASENVLARMVEELRSESCTRSFREMKAHVTLTESDETDINNYFEFKISSLIESSQDVCLDGDESELIRLLSHIWIEYRMEWIRYNTQMQYQTATRGQAEPKLALRGAGLSYLVGFIEKFLTQEEIYWCTKLAADPIKHLKSRSKLTERMVQIASSAGEAGKHIVENLVQMRDTLNAELRNPILEKGIEKILNNIETQLIQSTALTANDLHESFEMLLSSILFDSPVPFVLQSQVEDRQILIPSITIAGLNRLFEKWLLLLKSSSIESNIEARRQSGKTDHVNVQWTLMKGQGGQLVLTIEDDGLGTMSASDFSSVSSDWSMQQSHFPGKGSKIEVRFRGTQLANMIVFFVQGPQRKFEFALPAELVGEVLTDHQIETNENLSVTVIIFKNDEQVYPLIDLSKVLFEKSVKTASSVYIKAKCFDGKIVVIRATEIDLMIRDSTKTGPPTLSFIDGYLLTHGRVIAVLDIDKLEGVVFGKRTVSEAA